MAKSSSRNQTLSFLARRFEEAGIHPRTNLGQNFLIDLNLQRVLLDAARLGPDDVILEVGTGTGSLTELMARHVAAVVTVELDPQLFQLAAEELRLLENVTLLELDVLQTKNRLNPAMLEVVGQLLAVDPRRRFKLVANLPYNVATPILTNLLTVDSPPQTMTVTIQKELADRITAPPGTKDYGALSIWIQSQCRAEIIRVMLPSVFWPRPKVTSAIVHIAVDEQLRGRISNRDFFHRFVRAMFFHRRKFLRSELLSAFKGRLTKPVVDGILVGLRIEGNARAEQLDVGMMLALCKAIQAELGD